MARVLRKADRSDDALAIYADLRTEDDVLFLGAPVSLWAALAVVDELGDRGLVDRQHAAAAAIRKDLRQGRWKIDGPTLEMAWSQVTAPEMFAEEWQARWRDDGVVVRLSDPATGTPVVDAGVLATPSVIRTAADAKLRWTIQVASAAAASELDAFAGRRRTLVIVLALAMFLVLAGAYFVARGIRRELAVAELQSKFVSAVSHEFRTPLTSMSHLIELLRDRAHLDDARRARYYDALEQEADRLRRFVDRLLDFGRIAAGAAQYRFEATPPGELVGGLVDRFRASPSAQDHPVACEIFAGLPDVSIDRDSFALAFTNLLENAAKYSPAGTSIVVDVGMASAGRRLAIHVRDRGQGIPRAEQQRIFDKFVRGAAAQASGIRGTGVGLALARDIIRAHGGEIAVESAPGAGSTFTILLPTCGAREPDRVPSAGAELRA
jgi:signal transduction histidine kinase